MPDNPHESPIREIGSNDVNLSELTTAAIEYNRDYGTDQAFERAISKGKNDILLEATPETQEEVSRKIIVAALEDLRTRFRETFAVTGLGIEEIRGGTTSFLGEDDEVAVKLSASTIDIVLTDGKAFVQFIESLDTQNLTPEQALGIIDVIDGFILQLSSMYELELETKDHQIELINHLEDINRAATHHKDIDNARLQEGTLPELNAFAGALAQGALKEHVFINRWNLLDQKHSFLGGPKTWVNEVGRVEGDGVFDHFEYNWNKAIKIMINLSENPKAAELYQTVKTHLYECLKTSREYIEQLQKLPEGGGKKDQYYEFIDEQLEFLEDL